MVTMSVRNMGAEGVKMTFVCNRLLLSGGYNLELK